MKLCIDNADTKQIQRLSKIYRIDGVSTNPSILAKAGRPPYEVLSEIREIIGSDALLFVQAVGNDLQTISKEAERICNEVGKNTIIKIPATEAGLRAIKELSGEYNTLATAIYSPSQAFLACINGADWLAPYVNRISRFGGNGIEATCAIQDIIENNGFSSKILAASFHKNEEVIALAQRGVAAVTISPAIFDSLINVENVEDAVKAFSEDFENLTAAGKNMSNI